MRFTNKKIAPANKLIIKRQGIVALAMLLAGLLFFVLLKDLFFFDEDIFVTNLDGSFMHNMWQRSYVVKLTLAADHFLWGKNPLGYHVTNLVFHLIDAVLAMVVFKALLKFLPLQQESNTIRFAPLVSLILFLITPIHSESLCYILARGGSVVCFFCLLSIWLFIKADFKNKVLLFLSVLSFVIALFCYEISWLVPLMIAGIAVFIFYSRGLSLKRSSYFVLPFFLAFAAWFICKVVLLDKMEVSDYKDSNFFSIPFITILKNSAVLFSRNFIPPFKNTALFLIASVFFAVILCLAFFKLLKQGKLLFYFALSLLGCCTLAFAPVAIIGIDSHDSESERYIYFSSVFALMLVATLLTTVIKNKWLLTSVVTVLSGYYAFTTFTTISYYKKASDFSRQYLFFIDIHLKENPSTIFFVNQPSQYEGALLFRAKSKMGGNTNDNVGIMQEYLNYLYGKNVTCITLSKAELLYPPQSVDAWGSKIEKIHDKFPEIIVDTVNGRVGIAPNQMYSFDKNKTLIVVFKRDAIYFFR